MQFTSLLTSLAAAGALLAPEVAAQQEMAAPQMSSAMMAGGAGEQKMTTATGSMMGQKMSMMPSMTMGAGAPAKPTGGAGKSMIHKVMVSDEKGELKFTPASVQAAVGHMVEFMFHPNNHSVAQAAFEKPCMPMEMAMPGMTGFYSGFMPVTGKATKTFTIMVNDTKPMWFYCSQAEHCQKGMVGVINPPSNSQQTMQQFMEAAKNATKNISPMKIAGGTEKKKMMGTGKAKGSGMAKPTGSGKKTKTRAMGAAMPTGSVGAMGAGGAKAGGANPKGAMTGMSSMSTMAPMASMAGPMDAAAAASTPASAGAPAAAAASSSSNSTVKPSNGAAGNIDRISMGSPLGLLGLLAASFFLYA